MKVREFANPLLEISGQLQTCSHGIDALYIRRLAGVLESKLAHRIKRHRFPVVDYFHVWDWMARARFYFLKNRVRSFCNFVLCDLLESGQFEAFPKSEWVIKELMAILTRARKNNRADLCSTTPSRDFWLEQSLTYVLCRKRAMQ